MTNARLNFSNVIWNWAKQVALTFQNTLKETSFVCICYLICIFVHFICKYMYMKCLYTHLFKLHVILFPFFLDVPISKTNSFVTLISSTSGYIEIVIWQWVLFLGLLWIFIFYFCLYNFILRSGELCWEFLGRCHSKWHINSKFSFISLIFKGTFWIRKA